MTNDNISESFWDFDDLQASSNVTCKIRQNSSIPIPGIDFYEGIPITLGLNILAWILLLVCFTILRKVAWDYGRLALFNRNGFCTRNRLLEQNSTIEMVDKSVPKLQWSENCLWICNFFRLTNFEILQRCGRDAYIYLTFQRYLIAYVFLISLLSLIIILPVNLSGNYFSLYSDFGSLTIANAKTSHLWIHSVIALIFLLLAVVFMEHLNYYLKSLHYEPEEADDGHQKQKVPCTLMISNIKKPDKEAMAQYLTNRYSKEAIRDIQLTYDVATLTKLEARKKWATRTKLNAEQQSKLNNENDKEPPTLYPYSCAGLCGGCFCETCGCYKIDAVNFYSELEEKATLAFEVEAARTCKTPLGIMFVTMKQSDMADRMYNDFRNNGICNNRNRNIVNADSLVSDLEGGKEVILTRDWEVRFAPPVNNIIWENLSINGYKRWLRVILLNTVIFIICFFFTTPVIILEKLERFLDRIISSVFDKFLPTVILWLFACLLPNCIYIAHQFIGHHTRYSEHRAIMKKTFLFLNLMVIILPSLGLTSVQSIIEKGIVEHYQCIFASDNVAFFVNYVVTSAFLGTALELLRLPELLFYCVRMLLTRSVAERRTVRETQIYEFHFGFQYAWILCISSVILAYSIPCPLIAPCGFVYLLAKHAVDKYNIYFVYRPLRVHIGLHIGAGNLFIAAAILVPICVLAFISLRIGESQTRWMNPLFIFTLILLLIALVIFCDHVKFNQLARLTFMLFEKCCNWNFTQLRESIDDENDEAEFTPYVASVLKETKNYLPESDQCTTTRKNYGAVSNC